MKVEVMFDIHSVRKVNASELKRLIADGKILGFRRGTEWVMVGDGSMRGDGGDYGGPERRNVIQKPLPEPGMGAHFCVIPDNRSDQEDAT
ncbi:MAG TPA: hypothetical protein VIU41_05245 [Geobacteraceae bacterium]